MNRAASSGIMENTISTIILTAFSVPVVAYLSVHFFSKIEERREEIARQLLKLKQESDSENIERIINKLNIQTMENRVEKRISVTKEGREFLAKAFGVGDRIVAEALTYRRDSELCQKIRTLALKRGGFVINTLAEVETIHDSFDYMRQYFPNGMMLEFNKNNGECDAFLNGEVKKHWEHVRVSEIKGMQEWATNYKEEVA